MKPLRLFALTATLLLAGCGEKPAPPQEPGPSAVAPTPAAAPQTAATVTDGKKDLKEAVCVVCAAEGRAHGPEAVKASIEYQGKGYYFCNEGEKAEFISNPKKYAAPAS